MQYSEWSDDRKEKSRAAHRKWSANNKDKRKKYYSTSAQAKPQNYKLWRSSRIRKEKVPHTITPNDIIVPDVCPICDIPMKATHTLGGTRTSPTLDKVIPDLGYVPGNVAVICKYCNSTKGSGSAELHRKIADYIDSFN